MFRNESPLFIKKQLLKIEMLENLRDFPRDFVDIFYKNYSNGILKGCDVKVCGHNLLIQPGILIYNHMAYMMKDEVKIPYFAEDCEVFLKIKLLDGHKEVEKVSYLSQIILDTEKPNLRDEVELCRFRLQKGSVLREDYVDFYDLETTYDTINFIHVPYSDEGVGTISPAIVRIFAREVLNSRNKDSMDISFCMSVLRDSSNIPGQMIAAYLNARSRSTKQSYGNMETYKELVQILEDIEHGRNSGGASSERRKTVMLV